MNPVVKKEEKEKREIKLLRKELLMKSKACLRDGSTRLLTLIHSMKKRKRFHQQNQKLFRFMSRVELFGM